MIGSLQLQAVVSMSPYAEPAGSLLDGGGQTPCRSTWLCPFPWRARNGSGSRDPHCSPVTVPPTHQHIFFITIRKSLFQSPLIYMTCSGVYSTCSLIRSTFSSFELRPSSANNVGSVPVTTLHLGMAQLGAACCTGRVGRSLLLRVT